MTAEKKPDPTRANSNAARPSKNMDRSALRDWINARYNNTLNWLRD